MFQQFSRYAQAALTVVVTVTLGSDARAQPAEDKGYVGITTGGNIERAEDGLAGESAGVGLEAGVALTRNWALDFEVWVPRDFDTMVHHRDVLFNVSAVRFFHDTGVRPFALIGAGFGSVQQRFDPGNTTDPRRTWFLAAAFRSRRARDSRLFQKYGELRDLSARRPARRSASGCASEWPLSTFVTVDEARPLAGEIEVSVAVEDDAFGLLDLAGAPLLDVEAADP